MEASCLGSQAQLFVDHKKSHQRRRNQERLVASLLVLSHVQVGHRLYDVGFVWSTPRWYPTVTGGNANYKYGCQLLSLNRRFLGIPVKITRRIVIALF